MDWLQTEYVPVANARDLRRKPISRLVMGQPLMLARDPSGVPFALHDQCPHRGAPLSRGRLHGDQVECPYHGIVFTRDGNATSVPWSSDPCRLHTRPYSVLEQDGVLFASANPQAPNPPKLAAPPHWRQASLGIKIEAPFGEVVENFMDSTHTGVVHTGLIRSSKQRQPRIVHIIASNRTVTVQHEPTQEDLGIARRWLGSGAISHSDTCHLPGTVEVEYAINNVPFFRALIFASPRTSSATEVFARTAFAAPRTSHRLANLTRTLTDRLASLALPTLGQRILRQDQAILEATEKTKAQTQTHPRAYQPSEEMHRLVHHLLLGTPIPKEAHPTLTL